MQETDFPSNPFYIQSKIGTSNWALTVANVPGRADDWPAKLIIMKPLQGNVNFLWSAQKDPRGGSVLTHIASGLVLTANLGVSGTGQAPLGAMAADPTSSMQLFRAEDLDGNWKGINWLTNWAMKVNVYNADPNDVVGLYPWCGGSPNEEWLLLAETAQVETASIDYHTNLATVVALNPVESDVSPWDNTQGSVPLTGSTTISQAVTDSTQVTNSTSDTTGQKYTQSFGVKGGLDKVFEVNASASFEESSSDTTSFSDQTTHTTIETVTKTVNYNVPPGKRYEYQLLIHQGKINVPYTAHMKFQSMVPGSQPVLFDTQGVFTGVNTTQSEVVVYDRTSTATGEDIVVERIQGPAQIVKGAGA